MKKENVSEFDVSEFLDDESTIAEYLNAIIEEDDANLLLSAIGDIAKARGMAKIASQSGLGRESLYKALKSDAKPRFDTILKVLHAIGVDFKVSPVHPVTTSTQRRNPGNSVKRKSLLQQT